MKQQMPLAPDPRATYCFGAYRLDGMHRLLCRGSERTPLSEKLFMTLLLLVQAGGKVVTKQEFLARVWPEDSNAGATLAQHVYVLRKLLGQRPRDNAYIVTVGGVGYRFAAAVNGTPAQAHAVPEPTQRHHLANYFLEKRTARAMLHAAELFAEIRKHDPTDALALVGEARAQVLLAQQLHLEPGQAFGRAFRLLESALRIDPASAPANAVLAELHLWGNWDIAAAERALEDAVLLDSCSPLVHHSAAWIAICRRDFERARNELRRALSFDHASIALLLCESSLHVYEGAYRRAIAEMSDLLKTDPTASAVRRYRAQAYLFDGRPRLAAADLQALPDDPLDDAGFRAAMLARAYGYCERFAEAGALYERLRGLRDEHYVAEWNLAQAALGARLGDQTMLHLTRAYEAREPALLLMHGLPLFEPLERRPDYRRLVARMRNAPVSRPA